MEELNFMNTWFIADLHFNHAKIIEHSHRPFADVLLMNTCMINNWNSVVRPEDTVYVLGDIGFLKSTALKGLVSILAGRKHLIRGNHDKAFSDSLLLTVFESVSSYKEISVAADGLEKQKVVMCHYPFARWNRSHYGSWCLHGHSHGTYLPGRPESTNGRILDVGVDCHEFRPISLDEVKVIMAKKTIITVHELNG